MGLRDRIAKLELCGGRGGGLLILIEGGFPKPPITAEAKAAAHAELRLRGGVIVLGGLPKSGEQ